MQERQNNDQVGAVTKKGGDLNANSERLVESLAGDCRCWGLIRKLEQLAGEKSVASHQRYR